MQKKEEREGKNDHRRFDLVFKHNSRQNTVFDSTLEIGDLKRKSSQERFPS